MADRVILRAVTGDAISAMLPGELGYNLDQGQLILAGYGGIPAVELAPGVLTVAGRDGDVILSTTDINGLGSAATHPASDFAGASATSTALAGKLAKASNLSDLSAVPTARTNLGLGTAATRNVGSTSSDVAAGNAVLVLIKAGAPTAADIPAGQAAVVKDTTGGSVRLFYNDGGTLKSVGLA